MGIQFNQACPHKKGMHEQVMDKASVATRPALYLPALNDGVSRAK